MFVAVVLGQFLLISLVTKSVKSYHTRFIYLSGYRCWVDNPTLYCVLYSQRGGIDGL